MITIQEKVALAPFTSFRIGGEAQYFVDVKSVEELREALTFAKERSMNFTMLAGGTNVLISDKGISGLVIRVKMSGALCEGDILEAQAGTPLIKVINVAAENGLSGLESMAGVPGTLGGAVRGNAGAYGTEVGNYVSSVNVLDSESLEMKEFSKEESDFAYRSSFFKKNPKYILISAKLQLIVSTREECQAKVRDKIMDRGKAGLNGVRSAGMYFLNPKAESNEALLADFERERGVPARNGVLPAAWVIDRAGLGGKKIGGAMVSESNKSYIVNTGDATAEDIIILASFVKQQVRDQFGLQLMEEVELVGF